MEAAQAAAFAALAAEGIPRRYAHCMARFMPTNEWAYADALVALAAGGALAGGGGDGTGTGNGSPPADSSDGGGSGGAALVADGVRADGLLQMPAWLQGLAQVITLRILAFPDTFRWGLLHAGQGAGLPLCHCVCWDALGGAAAATHRPTQPDRALARARSAAPPSPGRDSWGAEEQQLFDVAEENLRRIWRERSSGGGGGHSGGSGPGPEPAAKVAARGAPKAAAGAASGAAVAGA
jgi:hypothetical protein